MKRVLSVPYRPELVFTPQISISVGSLCEIWGHVDLSTSVRIRMEIQPVFRAVFGSH